MGGLIEAHLDSNSQQYYLRYNDAAAAVRARACRAVVVAAAVLVGLVGALCRRLRTFGGISNSFCREAAAEPSPPGSPVPVCWLIVPSRYCVMMLPCAYPISVWCDRLWLGLGVIDCG